MRETSKAQCPNPECNSLNVIDTYDKMGAPQNLEKNGQFPKANIPIFKCNDCGERFLLLK